MWSQERWQTSVQMSKGKHYSALHFVIEVDFALRTSLSHIPFFEMEFKVNDTKEESVNALN